MRKSIDEPEEFDEQVPARLTAEEVQQVQFKRSFRGYDEREVDDFLDRMTHELTLLAAERGTGQGGTVTAPIAGAGAIGQADDILRRAREEAEAIVRRARQEAASITGGGTGAAPTEEEISGVARFVTRERDFLQRLARVIQEHAEGVKEMAQTARRAAAPQPATAGESLPEVIQVPEVGGRSLEGGSARGQELSHETGMAESGFDQAPSEPEPPRLPDLPPPPRDFAPPRETAATTAAPEPEEAGGGAAGIDMGALAEDESELQQGFGEVPGDVRAQPAAREEAPAPTDPVAVVEPVAQPEPVPSTVGSRGPEQARLSSGEREVEVERDVSIRELFWGEE